MDDAANNNEDFGAALAFLGFLPFIILFLVYVSSAVVAAVIAADRNRSPALFGLCTFFFLGPLGVGVALLATRGELDCTPWSPQWRPLVPGRRRYLCDRCGSVNDVVVEPKATEAECWACGEQWTVKPKQ